ncbi:SDR family NAD(P)-dependent oxidoreductase [Rhizobium sp. BK376]|uniref:SDR family NAD(P)-dependent oxidoreductase n=1 Tax=Rhizobium sp. BK376 TaxID=2512149 RepID=UPI0010441C03|nr:SDR family NAD(P)-dependent oxidoreductase [Rhizobium sp. BK376]TCR80870.1 NAD(P)-dependent dehydrogenase (short-subunit alcohol dehydrogenase family) [Rhizobium sp. BK376]
MQIEGKRVIVTGGGSGLGAATARRLAASGARLVLVDLDADRGAAIADAIGPQARFQRCDVTREEDCAKAVALATETFGGLEALINCAGIAPGEKVLGRSGPHGLESFTRTISINLVGTFNMLRLAAEVIAKAEPDEDGCRGAIVNTASIAAFEGQIGQAAYAASKGGVAAMTLPIAREFAAVGIRVVAIAPGLFETPLIAGMPPELQAKLGQSVPFPQRLGRPEEFAALVEHVIENNMINGEVIRLDGALRMSPR